MGIGRVAEVLHLKKREGHDPLAGSTRTIPADGTVVPSIGAAAAVHQTTAGPAELGGRVGTQTVPGYAAPGTPLNNPDTWEGPKVPPQSARMQPKH